jgi:hypothetical protein
MTILANMLLPWSSLVQARAWRLQRARSIGLIRQAIAWREIVSGMKKQNSGRAAVPGLEKGAQARRNAVDGIETENRRIRAQDVSDRSLPTKLSVSAGSLDLKPHEIRDAQPQHGKPAQQKKSDKRSRQIELPAPHPRVEASYLLAPHCFFPISLKLTPLWPPLISMELTFPIPKPTQFNVIHSNELDQCRPQKNQRSRRGHRPDRRRCRHIQGFSN